LEGTDLVVLATNHKGLVDRLSPSLLKKSGVKAVLDARNCLDGESIKENGIIYKGIGR